MGLLPSLAGAARAGNEVRKGAGAHVAAGPDKSREACRHLGLAGDAHRREAYPSNDHRCHLWSLRERIDLAHQRDFCLTARHRGCPWLSVPPPGHKPADRRKPPVKLAAGGLVSVLGALAVALGINWPGTGLAFGPAAAAGAQSAQSAQAGTLNLLSGAAPATDPAADTAAPAAGDRAAAPPPAAPVVKPFGTLEPDMVAAPGPETVPPPPNPSSISAVLAGNVGLSFSPKSLKEAGDRVTVHVEAHPRVNVPGGPAQFSPNGSIVDITVHDTAGKLVTTFPDPVTIVFKYNTADLAMAHGDARALSAAYVLDEDSPPIENPLRFPVSTWVFFPPDNIQLDPTAGTLSVKTQAIGSIMSVVAVGAGWAQTVRPDVRLYSSFDPARSAVFGTKKQFSYLRVTEPQIGSRLLVLDPDTGNYAYVDAKDVGPTGPPPPGLFAKL